MLENNIGEIQQSIGQSSLACTGWLYHDDEREKNGEQQHGQNEAGSPDDVSIFLKGGAQVVMFMLRIQYQYKSNPQEGDC
jgi:hypothetical protein